MALSLPGPLALYRFAKRARASPSPGREHRAARGAAGGARHRDQQAGDLPHLPPLLRDAPAGGRLGHPHGAGAARPRRRPHHDDLHPRAEPPRAGGPQPAGPGVAEPRRRSRMVMRNRAKAKAREKKIARESVPAPWLPCPLSADPRPPPTGQGQGQGRRQGKQKGPERIPRAPGTSVIRNP
ncbi:hypothetical protein BH23GEM6_BH23GEM6_15430 [soil metagenome]